MWYQISRDQTHTASDLFIVTILQRMKWKIQDPKKKKKKIIRREGSYPAYGNWEFSCVLTSQRWNHFCEFVLFFWTNQLVLQERIFTPQLQSQIVVYFVLFFSSFRRKNWIFTDMKMIYGKGFNITESLRFVSDTQVISN